MKYPPLFHFLYTPSPPCPFLSSSSFFLCISILSNLIFSQSLFFHIKTQIRKFSPSFNLLLFSSGSLLLFFLSLFLPFFYTSAKSTAPLLLCLIPSQTNPCLFFHPPLSCDFFSPKNARYLSPGASPFHLISRQASNPFPFALLFLTKSHTPIFHILLHRHT